MFRGMKKCWNKLKYPRSYSLQDNLYRISCVVMRTINCKPVFMLITDFKRVHDFCVVKQEKV